MSVLFWAKGRDILAKSRTVSTDAIYLRRKTADRPVWRTLKLVLVFLKIEIDLIRSSYLHVKAKREWFSQFDFLVSLDKNWIQQREKTFDWWSQFCKKESSMLPADILQQIFLKRHNHNLLICYKLRPFHQILKPWTWSRKNLSSIHWFTRFDNYRSKNSWYN